MSSQAEWKTVPSQDLTGNERLFFDDYQRKVIEAASARIIPTDDDPGATEARVVNFIDRYLSGIEYVYATADGTGFLQIEGKDAQAWRERVTSMQERYTEGIRSLNELSHEMFQRSFTDLEAQEQDEVLVRTSGWPKPEEFTIRAIVQGRDVVPGEGGAPPSNQPIPDDQLDFFPMLVLHVRQGFYSDPVYGGNRDRIGWTVIGYPGPSSLAETQAGKYTTIDYMLPDAKWPFAEYDQSGK